MVFGYPSELLAMCTGCGESHPRYAMADGHCVRCNYRPMSEALTCYANDVLDAVLEEALKGADASADDCYVV